MEKFKGVLKKRVSVMLSLNGVALIGIVLMWIYSSKISGPNEGISDLIRGFQVGIFLGLQMIMVFFVFKYEKALKNDEKLKAIYIEENDERAKLIQDKIGGVGYTVVFGGVGTMAVISGFFNQVVFITLLAVLFFVGLVKGVLKIYYNKKF